MSEFLHMDGYAAYVWCSYGLTLIVLVGNFWLARRNLSAQLRQANRRNLTQEST